MGDEYGLLRFDDDNALLALFAVKTSLVRLYRDEFLRGDMEALPLNFLDVFLVGKRGDDGFDFGGGNLQQTGISRQWFSDIKSYTEVGDRLSDPHSPSTRSCAYREAGGRSPDARAFGIKDGSLIDIARGHEASKYISRCAGPWIGIDSYLVSTYSTQRSQSSKQHTSGLAGPITYAATTWWWSLSRCSCNRK